MKKLLYIHRVAKLLDCSRPMVYKLITEGKIQAVRIGIRGLRITEDSYNEFIENNIINPDDLGVDDFMSDSQSELNKRSQKFKDK